MGKNNNLDSNLPLNNFIFLLGLNPTYFIAAKFEEINQKLVFEKDDFKESPIFEYKELISPFNLSP